MTDRDSRAGAPLNDCWNRIGTWGKETPRCERLADLAHCSNCDIYRGAGRVLLQRPPPRGYLEEWREFLAAKPAGGSPSGRFFVLFELRAQLYALPTSALQQVADASPIRALPHNRSAALLGVVNVRGDVLPCVDLSALIEPLAPPAQRTAVAYRRLLVSRPGNARWVFPVEQVVGLQRLEREQLSAVVSPDAVETLVEGKVVWEQREVQVVSAEALARRLEGFDQ